jgi:hypothetical protein
MHSQAHFSNEVPLDSVEEWVVAVRSIYSCLGVVVAGSLICVAPRGNARATDEGKILVWKNLRKKSKDDGEEEHEFVFLENEI